MTTFYICRHGETENNKKGRLSGWIDTALTEEGLRNVQSAAAKLKAIKFDSIHSSDLGRAFITAYLIARALGYSDEIHRHKGLREVNYGDYANALGTDLVADNIHLLNDTNFVAPNGESLSQMQQRVLACLDDIASKYPDQTILIASHDGPINAIYANYASTDLGELMKSRENPHDFVARFTIANGHITSFVESTSNLNTV